MYIIYILEIFIQSVTVGHSEEKKSEFSKRGDLLATIVSPDAPPLSYMRLVGARASKLGSCVKHPASC